MFHNKSIKGASNVAAIVCALYVALLAFAITTPANAEETLTGEQIKQLLSDKKGKCKGKNKVQMEWTADGKTDGFVPGKGWSDKGKWWIEGNAYCRKWERWGDAKQKCLSVKQDETKITFLDDGKKISECKIKG